MMFNKKMIAFFEWARDMQVSQIYLYTYIDTMPLIENIYGIALKS